MSFDRNDEMDLSASYPDEGSIQPKTSRIVLDVVRKQKRAERIIMGIVLMFGLSVGGLAWYTDGEVFTVALKTLRQIEGSGDLRTGNVSADCQKTKNKNTPYCQERKAEVASTWDSITRLGGGGRNAFPLHGKSKRYN